MSDIHELKADPTPFEDVYSGRKTAEVRRDDRGYKVGDYLQIRETTADRMAYTGRQLGRRITHIQRGYGLPDGVVVLSLESRPTPEQSRETRKPIGYVNERMLSVLGAGTVSCTHISPKRTEFQQIAIYTEAK